MLKELKERVCRANLLLVEYGLVFSKGTPGRRWVFCGRFRKTVPPVHNIAKQAMHFHVNMKKSLRFFNK